MTAQKRKYFFFFFLPVLLLCMSVSLSYGGVLVLDTVAARGAPVRLTVITKGRFFSEGGRLVDVYLEQKHLGRILSGGDGYGFLKYTPRDIGLKKIEVRSDGDIDKGVLLVAGKEEKIIVIEVETCLGRSFFNRKAQTDSKKAIKAISERYIIIYVTRLIGITISKKLLAQNQYPRSAILRWQGSELLDELKGKGLKLYAIIASAELLSESSEFIDRRYSFKETEEATVVSSWKEILKHLNEEKK